ncbi:MAG: hypothetical protein U0795_12830 [Pirellulales bacterium]
MVTSLEPQRPADVSEPELSVVIWLGPGDVLPKEIGAVMAKEIVGVLLAEPEVDRAERVERVLSWWVRRPER